MNNLVKYRPSLLSPFNDFLDADDIWSDNWLSRSISRQPAVNIAEKDNEYVVELAAPGYKKEDFKINTDDGLLTVSAEAKNEKKEDHKDYTRREYSCSSFSRSFRLPDHVKEDKVAAKYEDGVLRLQIPKEAPSPAKQKKQIAVS